MLDFKVRAMISIVTITRNNYSELLATLESIRGVPNVESIVINGGTCVDTKRYLDTHPGIVVTEPDYGIADAMNKGLALATGTGVMFLNSGDLLLDSDYPGFAHEMLKSYDFVHSDIIFDDAITGKMKMQPARCELGRGMPYFHQSMVVKRSVFKEIGNFSLDYKIAMDFDFVVRLEKFKKRGLYYQNKPTILMDGQGISALQESKSIAECKRSLQARNMYSLRQAWGLRVRNLAYLVRTWLKLLHLTPLLAKLKRFKHEGQGRNTLGVFLIGLYFCSSLSAMAVMNIGFFLFVFYFIISQTTGRNRLTEVSKSFKSYLYSGATLFFACLTSLVFAKFFPYSYAGHAPEITAHGFLKIWYLLIPAIIYFGYQEKQSLDGLINVWESTLIPLAALSLIQFFTGIFGVAPITANPGYYHATLFLGHHLSVASIIAFPTFTALSRFFSNLGTNKNYKRLLCGLAGLLILFLSYARTAWLSIPLGFFILALRYIYPKVNRKTAIIGTIGAILTVFVLIQTPLLHERVTRFDGIRERIILWKANIDFFTHRPITGIGWLKTQEMSQYYFKELYPDYYQGFFWGHAHSNFFEMLGGTGLLGVLAFLWWSFFTLALGLKLSHKQNPYHDIAFGLTIGLFILHFNGLTNVTFWEGKVMHQQMIAIGLLLVIDRLQKAKIK